jgi:hypothetical protein
MKKFTNIVKEDIDMGKYVGVESLEDVILEHIFELFWDVESAIESKEEFIETLHSFNIENKIGSISIEWIEENKEMVFEKFQDYFSV